MLQGAGCASRFEDAGLTVGSTEPPLLSQTVVHGELWRQMLDGHQAGRSFL
jgi:hypothetical protein